MTMGYFSPCPSPSTPSCAGGCQENENLVSYMRSSLLRSPPHKAKAKAISTLSVLPLGKNLKLCALGLRNRRNYLGELRLERGTSDEEAVDVWHRRQLWRILGIGRTTVLDANALSDLSGGLLADQLADTVMRILWGCGETSADGPDRLVGNHHLLRIQFAVDLCELNIHLRQDCLQTLFADFLPLADAEAASHAGIEDILKLGRKRGIVIHLVNPELAPALRVPDQHLRNTHVLHLLHRHLAGECTAPLKIAILRRQL